MLIRLLQQLRGRGTRMDAVSGYDLWSYTYDDENDNLLVALDETMFAELLAGVDLNGKQVTDVGCGTGRHWPKVLERGAASLTGYDTSAGMLERLRRKRPDAVVHQSGADHLLHTPSAGCDLVISTLALCHVPDARAALVEWSRVLRPGGDLLLTDYHASAAASGVCSFRSEGRLIIVEHHVHPLPQLLDAAAGSGLELVRLEERLVDDSMREPFAARGQLAAFERMKGKPLLYGIHLRKPRSPILGAAAMAAVSRP